MMTAVNTRGIGSRMPNTVEDSTHGLTETFMTANGLKIKEPDTENTLGQAVLPTRVNG